MIVYFQIMAQLSKLLQQKIPVLYQRNRDIVFDRKHNIFNQFCLIFSLQIKRNTSYILENSCYSTKCQMCQNFFRFSNCQSYTHSNVFLLSLFSTNQMFNISFFSSSIVLTVLFNFNLVHVLVPFPVLIPVQ